ncbi:hypothetical protein ACO0SA_004480 [Hanseniaspora valbyensis]
MSFDNKNKNKKSKLKDFSIGNNDIIPSLVTCTEEIDESKLKDTVQMITKEKIESCNKQLKNIDETSIGETEKIPLTIITGYLGSGKSTMLNYITNNVNTSNLKIAVIMNEFGDTLDIEKSITIYNKEQSDNKEAASTVEWLDLGNGCICCSVKDVGVKAIEDLVKRQKGAIDYIILETSGLAEPSNIVKMFWQDDGLMTNIKLDGIVTVLDGSNIENILNNKIENNIAISQIGIADKIILNKVDMIDTNKLPLIENRLKNINNSSEMVTTKFGQLTDLHKILFLNSYSNFSDYNEKIDTENIKTHNEESIETIKIDLPILTTINQFTALKQYLQKIHWQNFGYNYGDDEENIDKKDKYGDIFRTKGLIICSNFDPFKENIEVTGLTYKVIQGVRDTFDIMNTSSKPLDNMKNGKLVLIGKKLKKQLMVNELESLLKDKVEEIHHIHTGDCKH